MSDFFSPLEEDDVRRTRQDEDEERLAKEALDAVGDRARVFALWNEETRDAIERGALKPTTLLVATTPWACGLVFDTVEAGAVCLRPMGTITVAGVSARNIAASGTIGREDPVGVLFRAETTETTETSAPARDDRENLCVLTVNHDVPADRAREYAKTLLESVNAEHVVVLTAVDENVLEEPSFDEADVDRDRDPFRCFAARAGTGATTTSPTSPTSERFDDASCAPLPAGVLLDGLAAAIAARREMAGERATVLAVPTPGGGRGSARGSRGAGADAGPGFGGGVDARVAASAARCVAAATGIDVVAGLTWRAAAGNGKVVGGDAERVFS